MPDSFSDSSNLPSGQHQQRQDGIILDVGRGQLLGSRGVSVWFSDKEVLLGSTLLREIDKGLAKSRIGLVLVTPALLRALQRQSIADKELSALLARDLLVPIVHDTTSAKSVLCSAPEAA